MMLQSATTTSIELIHRVAFVGTCPGDLLADLMVRGTHDVVYVEALTHAYSCIKRVHPDFVIVALREDDVEGCRVLSMLALDPETAHIPVFTYLTPADGDGSASQESFDRPDGFVLN
jgi:hypothetical protein